MAGLVVGLTLVFFRAQSDTFSHFSMLR
jgi:hypothetical protein